MTANSEVDNAVEATKRQQTTDSHSHSQPQPLTAEVMSYYADSVMLFVLVATPIRWGDSGPLERARSGFSSSGIPLLAGGESPVIASLNHSVARPCPPWRAGEENVKRRLIGDGMTVV